MFETPILAASGLLVQRHLSALRVEVAAIRKLTRRFLRELLAAPGVRLIVQSDAEQRRARLAKALAITSEAIALRHATLLRSLEQRSARHSWQASLFDRRQERAASRRAAEIVALRGYLQRRCEAARQLAHLRTADPRVVAAWVAEG
jgi:hypothetical protein